MHSTTPLTLLLPFKATTTNLPLAMMTELAHRKTVRQFWGLFLSLP